MHPAKDSGTREVEFRTSKSTSNILLDIRLPYLSIILGKLYKRIIFRWFQGFDWTGLRQRILTPPVSPTVMSPTDTTNFDCYSKEAVVPPDEFSNWDAEF